MYILKRHRRQATMSAFARDDKLIFALSGGREIIDSNKANVIISIIFLNLG